MAKYRNTQIDQEKLRDILSQTPAKELDDIFGKIFNDLNKKLVQEPSKNKEAAE
jgi:arsenate reductase-like glutaredoxin family protein